MRVTNETAYRSLLNQIERISERMQKTQLEVASGKKLHKPSDDPTAVSDVLRLNAEKSEMAQYQDNVATAKSRLNFTDMTLQGVETMVERVRTLALLAQNNPATASTQTSEIDGIRSQILSAANATFDGQAMFAGSNVDGPAYTQASDGTVTYNGNAQGVSLQVGRSQTLQVHVPGSDVFSGSVDIFSTIKDLTAAMNAGDKSAISANVSKLEQFTTVIGSTLGRVGGLVNVAQSIETDLTQYSLVRTAEIARLEDADLPSALTDYTQAETALKAATAIGARISNISILDYLS
jgi:flagellar hook-associated protein 3 FlgL